MVAVVVGCVFESWLVETKHLLIKLVFLPRLAVQNNIKGIASDPRISFSGKFEISNTILSQLSVKNEYCQKLFYEKYEILDKSFECTWDSVISFNVLSEPTAYVCFPDGETATPM